MPSRIIRCARFRSATPPSRSIAATTAPSISGPKSPLGEYPVRLTDRLHHWARLEPNRIFMAERGASGGWRQITYAQLLASTRSIASALLARGLSADEPIVILSGNSIDHALMAFGALYAGIPFCPVSPAYSLVSKDYGKLAYLMKLLTPGLVFADDAGKFADALGANVPDADRDRCLAWRSSGPWRDDARRSAGDAGASGASMRRTTRSVRIRSPNSC